MVNSYQRILIGRYLSGHICPHCDHTLKETVIGILDEKGYGGAQIYTCENIRCEANANKWVWNEKGDQVEWFGGLDAK